MMPKHLLGCLASVSSLCVSFWTVNRAVCAEIVRFFRDDQKIGGAFSCRDRQTMRGFSVDSEECLFAFRSSMRI